MAIFKLRMNGSHGEVCVEYENPDIGFLDNTPKITQEAFDAYKRLMEGEENGK